MTVFVEVTKRCNLDCKHCYVSGAGAELSTGRLLELFAELRAAGTIWIVLTGGEVSLRPDWLELVRGVRENDMVVSLLTNGAGIGEQDLEHLIQLRPARVSVSLYSHRSEVHDTVTGVQGSFARSVATLERLRAADIPCKVACPLMQDNIDDFTGLIELAERLGCDYQFDPTISPKMDGDASVTSLRVSADGLGKFFLHPAIAGHSREGRLASGLEQARDRVKMTNCAAGFSMAFIDATGDVYPCIGFPPAFGSVRSGTFSEAWSSPVAQHHRRSMEQPLVECEACDISAFCGRRCPRLALAEGGDLCGPSPRSCDMARLVQSLGATVSAADGPCMP